MIKNTYHAGICLFLAAALLIGCNKEMQQMRKYVKTGTRAEKEEAAYYFYKTEDYERAEFLFEELWAVNKTTEKGEKLLYHYAYSKYHQGLYTMSAYYFEQLVKLYPYGEYTEEAAFQKAYCYYIDSDPHYLDQRTTGRAINEFRIFMSGYPDSKKVQESQEYIMKMRERLAKKAFENAKLYFKIENYKGAKTAFQVMVQEYPESRYREEAQFLHLQSAYELANVSVQTKKKDRYLDAVDLYERFVDKYPYSTFLKDAENLYERTLKNIKKLEEAEEKTNS